MLCASVLRQVAQAPYRFENAAAAFNAVVINIVSGRHRHRGPLTRLSFAVSSSRRSFSCAKIDFAQRQRPPRVQRRSSAALNTEMMTTTLDPTMIKLARRNGGDSAAIEFDVAFTRQFRFARQSFHRFRFNVDARCALAIARADLDFNPENHEFRIPRCSLDAPEISALAPRRGRIAVVAGLKGGGVHLESLRSATSIYSVHRTH